MNLNKSTTDCFISESEGEFYQYAPVQEDLEEMAWIKPEHSKGAVSRAGDVVKNPSSTDEEYSNALDIVSNWRSSHAFPLNNLRTLLRDKAIIVDKNALVTQRLKRVPSIISKLNRIPTLKLDTMQDLGGCRAIVENLDKVYRLRDLMISSSTKNKLVKEDDYIAEIKKSGYRGIHLIYKYRGKKEDIYSKHSVEIQIRTKIQHAWATTVEIVGTFLGESLKSGEGSEKWLKFFEFVSIAFAILEGNTPNISTLIKKDIINLIEELDVYKKLETFSLSTEKICKVLSEKNEYGHFLLSLDIPNRRIDVFSYTHKMLSKAIEDYIELEKQHRNDTKTDIVLVSSQSVKNLRRSYPNYFADSAMFLEKLQKILSTNEIG